MVQSLTIREESPGARFLSTDAARAAEYFILGRPLPRMLALTLRTTHIDSDVHAGGFADRTNGSHQNLREATP